MVYPIDKYMLFLQQDGYLWSHIDCPNELSHACVIPLGRKTVKVFSSPIQTDWFNHFVLVYCFFAELSHMSGLLMFQEKRPSHKNS